MCHQVVSLKYCTHLQVCARVCQSASLPPNCITPNCNCSAVAEHVVINWWLVSSPKQCIDRFVGSGINASGDGIVFLRSSLLLFSSPLLSSPLSPLSPSPLSPPLSPSPLLLSPLLLLPSSSSPPPPLLLSYSLLFFSFSFSSSSLLSVYKVFIAPCLAMPI